MTFEIDPFRLNTFKWDSLNQKTHTQLLPISTLQDPEKEIVKPAIELTRAVILAALKNNVRRVVVTSSGGAIFSFPIPENKVFTAQDWNMQSSLSNNPYFYSKRLAEEEAWKLYQENKEKFELVVVNPVYVLGKLIIECTYRQHEIFCEPITKFVFTFKSLIRSFTIIEY